MTRQVPRIGAGLLLVAAGGLMTAASWQRWADGCPWGAGDSAACLTRQDHRYDFLAPTTGWEPVGHRPARAPEPGGLVGVEGRPR